MKAYFVLFVVFILSSVSAMERKIDEPESVRIAVNSISNMLMDDGVTEEEAPQLAVCFFTEMSQKDIPFFSKNLLKRLPRRRSDLGYKKLEGLIEVFHKASKFTDYPLEIEEIILRGFGFLGGGKVPGADGFSSNSKNCREIVHNIGASFLIMGASSVGDIVKILDLVTGDYCGFRFMPEFAIEASERFKGCFLWNIVVNASSDLFFGEPIKACTLSDADISLLARLYGQGRIYSDEKKCKLSDQAEYIMGKTSKHILWLYSHVSDGLRKICSRSCLITLYGRTFFNDLFSKFAISEFLALEQTILSVQRGQIMDDFSSRYDDLCRSENFLASFKADKTKPEYYEEMAKINGMKRFELEHQFSDENIIDLICCNERIKWFIEQGIYTKKDVKDKYYEMGAAAKLSIFKCKKGSSL